MTISSSSPWWSRRRRTLSVVLLPSLLLLSQYPLIPTAKLLSTVTGTYVPLSYPLQPNEGECLYERISQPNEDLTASVFVNTGDDMRAIIIFEGPVAPIDLDFFDNNNDIDGLVSAKGGHGAILAGYITRYNAEGSKMFVDGKFGDNMMNVRPFSHHVLVDFEYIEEEDTTLSSYEPTSPPAPAEHRRQVEEHHRQMMEEQRRRWMQEREEAKQQGFDVMEDDAAARGRQHAGDDVVYTEHEIEREEALLEQVDHEGEVDDDFVKMQIRNMNPRPTLSTTIPPPPKDEEDGEHHQHHQREGSRRLSEAITRPPPGEPYQYTSKIVSPGWYRLCVYPATKTAIEVEIELRKSSSYGKVATHTGHVPNLEEVEVHSEIRALYSEGETPPMRPVEGGHAGIADDDLRTTREQLRILERVYGEIINRQLEERRKWNWRSMKNQHIYSHLVLGNLIETVVYMIITGWQVYTIRKWFSNSGPKLGR